MIIIRKKILPGQERQALTPEYTESQTLTAFVLCLETLPKCGLYEKL